MVERKVGSVTRLPDELPCNASVDTQLGALPVYGLASRLHAFVLLGWELQYN